MERSIEGRGVVAQGETVGFLPDPFLAENREESTEEKSRDSDDCNCLYERFFLHAGGRTVMVTVVSWLDCPSVTVNFTLYVPGSSKTWMTSF